MTVKENLNRSDQIRQRRITRPRRPKPTGSHRRATRTTIHSIPRVTVRGGFTNSKLDMSRKAKKSKRRYDVALNTEGAEIRLPSLPRFAIGWRLLSATIVAVLGFTVYTLMYNPLFQVADIQVEGLRRLTKQEINAVSDIVAKSILFVDPEKIQEDLLVAFPDLESVSVDVAIPSTVTVQAVERVPVLAWEKDGRVVWVDSSGIAFPPRGDSGPLVKVVASSLPAIAQPDEDAEITTSGTETLPVDLVEAILAMAEQAPENTTIVFDEGHGLGWHDAFGWVVYFGKDAQDMDQKLKVYRVLAKRLKKADPRPELISVEYLHAPYYRLEH